MSIRILIENNAKLSPPKWLSDNIVYETIMGSDAYGVSSGASDVDVYGVVIPPKEFVFPHTVGEISGFGRQIQKFNSWQEHHIEYNKKSYDFQIYGIVNFFHLAMENNPNIIDSIFTPRRCVLSSTQIGEIIRENKQKFLHKGSWHKLKGYAYSQLHKISSSKQKTTGTRKELIEKFGYDVKFAYHVVRLLNQAEQILSTGDLDLEQNREQLKSIRRGEWTYEQLVEWAQTKEKQLEQLYLTSKLQHSPDEQEIKNILLQCLEHHYGNLSSIISVSSKEHNLLKQIADIVKGY